MTSLLRRLANIRADPPTTEPEAVTWQITGEQAFLAVIEEYKALRAEICERLRAQATLIASNVTLVGAGLVGAQLTKDRVVLVLVPLVSFLLGFAYLSQDRNLILAGSYIDQRLAPLIRACVPGREDVFGWEDYHAKREMRGVSLNGLLGHMASVLPGLLGLAFVIRDLVIKPDRWTPLHWILLSLAVACGLLLVGGWISMRIVSKDIGRRPSSTGTPTMSLE